MEIRAAADRALLGFDPAPGPDRTVLTVAPPADAVSYASILRDVERLMPAPVVVAHVVPNGWLDGPIGIGGGQFILPEASAEELLRMPGVAEHIGRGDLLLDVGLMRTLRGDRPAPRRRSKGWRRHVRRTKAARRSA